MERKPYSAGAVKFSFWFMEFRKTVQLLSEGKSFADIKKLNEETNIYGAPTKLRAQQIYSTVTARIKTFANRRFIVSKAALGDDGIDHMSMGRILGNEDSKMVSYPVSSNVFKVAGGGANYVHGGSSPQEMLVPVLEFKMERGHMETKNAEIALVSIVHKITNLITSMDFIQSDAVSDTVKAAKYRIFFLSEDNEKISNENSYVADSREENAQKRIFRMRFTFKNKKYDKDKQYYLVVYDEESGLEQWRQPVIMDIAFADDFGFGF